MRNSSLRLFPHTPQQRIVRMKWQITRHGSYQVTVWIENPHDHTTVVFALVWTRFMDHAPDKISLRPEKPAGSRVLIRKRVVQKDLMLIIINSGDERCSGRNRLAGKFKGTYLVFDYDIVTHIHTARSALPAGKHHQNSLRWLSFLPKINRDRTGWPVFLSFAVMHRMIRFQRNAGSRFHQRSLQMLPSRELKEVLARLGLPPDSIAFLKKANLHIFSDINTGINEI